MVNVKFHYLSEITNWHAYNFLILTVLLVKSVGSGL